MYGDANETFNPEPVWDIHTTGPGYTERDDWPSRAELNEEE